MTSKLPVVSASKLLSLLEHKGFVRVRQSGSHIILRHADGRRTTVPMHKGRDLGKGLLRQIMRDAELTGEELFT